ncbi:uncharacterized protein FMAN_15308 [Fusarium mangiferae]|uniref:Uncharacterized protein n=1 Tax=Fusarium mangiferae TaxID=192010 RepID=A0A1L7UHG2_FUSMA|nr:uncharacterized protein FMAN_15308 [Fusarium mangiferae]CVL07177.1 uncharacterized protein FMAN_15308 [Fusarium mangiferae]
MPRGLAAPRPNTAQPSLDSPRLTRPLLQTQRKDLQRGFDELTRDLGIMDRWESYKKAVTDKLSQKRRPVRDPARPHDLECIGLSYNPIANPNKYNLRGYFTLSSLKHTPWINGGISKFMPRLVYSNHLRSRRLFLNVLTSTLMGGDTGGSCTLQYPKLPPRATGVKFTTWNTSLDRFIDMTSSGTGPDTSTNSAGQAWMHITSQEYDAKHKTNASHEEKHQRAADEDEDEDDDICDRPSVATLSKSNTSRHNLATREQTRAALGDEAADPCTSHSDRTLKNDDLGKLSNLIPQGVNLRFELDNPSTDPMEAVKEERRKEGKLAPRSTYRCRYCGG